ncbi:MAG TPA: MYXO-CTERM sorting domain-containing protein, partial [Myxococcales bacterium]|nr:MYXO-CTERM sorting domain-containing protein [Myxococcales bacterium]
EIWNGFYWEVFAGLSSSGFKGCSGSCEAAPEIMYKTIQLAAGGDGPSFSNYWQTFKAAALALHPTQPSVAAYADCVAKRRGFDQCDSTVPLYGGEAKLQFVRLRYSPFQVALQLTGASSFRICDTQGLTTTLYANKGSPVTLTNIDSNANPPSATISTNAGSVTFTQACSAGLATITLGSAQGAGTYYLLLDSPDAFEGANPGQDVYAYVAFDANGNSTGLATRPAAAAPATCTPPTPFAITATVDTSTHASGGILRFTTTGGSNTGINWTVLTNNSGGTVDSSGQYTAGATANVTDTLQAADSLGDTAQIQVTVTPAPNGGGCASTDAGFAALFAGVAMLLQARRRRAS